MSTQYRKKSATLRLTWLCAALLVLLTSCLGGAEETFTPPAGDQAATQVADLAYTQAAETIAAELTAEQPTAEVAQLSDTPTETLPPTSTPLPTDTPAPTDTPLPTETPLPSVTATDTATPLPTEPTFVLVYEDNFTASQGWPDVRSDGVNMRYGMGGYLITNDIVDDIAYATRRSQSANVRLEVDATKMSGPMDGYYGVICGFSNGGNYYVLAVGGDGWYGIGKKVSSRLTWMQQGQDSSGRIFTGNSLNRVRGDCVGGTLTLFANGHQLAQAKDSTFFGGSVGLAVGTHKDPGVEVVFDNFQLYVVQE
jgi:hypothetical protein